jgi:pyruvate dehydrogenase E1 component
MMTEQKNVFYYVTVMNENYAQPDFDEKTREHLIRGAYVFGEYGEKSAKQHVTLLGSGAILTEVIKAAKQLAEEGIASTVVSVTSWSELARDGASAERGNDIPHVTSVLNTTRGPIIAATDYVRLVPESVRAYVPEGRRYTTLGTDGFGRSDTRAALREFFGVDARSIVDAAKRSLLAQA